MELLIENWDLVLIIVIAIVGLGFGVFKWLSLPTSKQKEQIRTVLLQLVILAENKFGEKTGAVKRSFVYSELIKHFSWLKYLPLSIVDELIEESLVVMRKMLASNVQVKKIVEGDK